jgi:hypothetical protein
LPREGTGNPSQRLVRLPGRDPARPHGQVHLLQEVRQQRQRIRGAGLLQDLGDHPRLETHPGQPGGLLNDGHHLRWTHRAHCHRRSEQLRVLTSEQIRQELDP